MNKNNTKHIFLFLCLCFVTLCSTATLQANPETAFKDAANQFIEGDKEAAKKSVETALQHYPQNGQLQRLKELLENQQDQDEQQNQDQQQQDQQNQQDQNQSSSEEDSQNQDSPNSDQEQSDQEKQEQESSQDEESSELEDEPQKESPENAEETEEDKKEPEGEPLNKSEKEEDEDKKPDNALNQGEQSKEAEKLEADKGAMTQEQARALLESLKKHEKKLPISFSSDKKDRQRDSKSRKNW